MENQAYSKINNFCLIFLTGFAMTGTLIFMKPALVPLVFSFFLYGIVTSLVRWTSKHLQINKMIALAVVLIVLGLVTYTMVWTILHSIGEFFVNFEEYKNHVITLLQSIIDQLPLKSLGWNIETVLEEFRHMPYFTYVKAATGTLVKFTGNIFLILAFLFFFLLGESKSEMTNPLLKNILEKVTTYVSIKFFTSFLTGLLTGIILFSFGIKTAVLLAFLTLILNFIPNIGATVATIIPIPAILFQYGYDWHLVLILSLLILIHILIGYFLDPKIMGESLDLHPVTILVFLIFWGLVWGIPGLFLAVPITSILKIVLSRLENTQTIAEVLSGRLPRE